MRGLKDIIASNGEYPNAYRYVRTYTRREKLAMVVRYFFNCITDFLLRR